MLWAVPNKSAVQAWRYGGARVRRVDSKEADALVAASSMGARKQSYDGGMTRQASEVLLSRMAYQ